MRRMMLRAALRRLGARGDMAWVRKNRKLLAGLLPPWLRGLVA